MFHVSRYETLFNAVVGLSRFPTFQTTFAKLRATLMLHLVANHNLKTLQSHDDMCKLHQIYHFKGRFSIVVLKFDKWIGLDGLGKV